MGNRGSRMIWVRSLGLLACLCLAVEGQVLESALHREKAAHRLGAVTLDASRLAVIAGPEVEISRVRSRAAAHGLDARGVEVTRLAGVSLAKLSDELSNEVELRRLSAALAVENGLRFVSPVYVDAEGRVLTLTPELLVTFDRGMAFEDARSILQSTAAGTVEPLDDASSAVKVRFRTALRDGFEVLALAERVSALARVQSARVNRLLLPDRGLVYFEPTGAEQVHRYDGTVGQVEGEVLWRAMCGSDTSQFHLEDLKRVARQARERAAEAQAMPQAGGEGGVAAAAATLDGLDIEFIFTTAIPPEALPAIAAVEEYIESQFSDPVVVRINLAFEPMSPGVLGGAGSNYAFDSWVNIRTGLQNGNDGDDDILEWLPAGSTIPVRYNGNSPTITNENIVFATRANYRATIGSVTGLAASITINTNFPWDYTPPDIDSGTWDFQSVLVHEVGHVLGFTSGADFRFMDMEMLDIFRFQRSDGTENYNPDTFEQFQTTPRLVTINSPGTDDDVNSDLITVEYRMSDGDPRQASHFHDQNPPIGIMDPTIGSEQTFAPNFFLTADRDMFDAIGWDSPPKNLSCETAREMGCNTLVKFDNTIVDNAPSPSLSCAGGGSPDGTLWFKFVATDTSANVSSCQSFGTNTVFAVYEGTCGNLVELDCRNDDGCGGSGQLGQRCLSDLTIGNTYYIQFAAASAAARGLYRVDLTCSCVGACCLPPPQLCDEMIASQCAAIGGSYAGPDTACLGDNNGTGVDDGCESQHVKVSQLPTGGATGVASNLDWSDMEPAQVVLDDFLSDGRPVTALRWWGSTLDEKVIPDGWLISFHQPQAVPGSADAPLGLYYCDASVVTSGATPIPGCDDDAVRQYDAVLVDCCLLQAEVDGRSGATPARHGAFEEESCFDYDLGIQALVGLRFEEDTENPGTCVPVTTAASAPGEFWAWHATGNEEGFRTALTGSVGVAGPDWSYGPWSGAAPLCGSANMAFELLSAVPGGSNPTVFWDNGPPISGNALNSQFGGQVTDHMTVDDFILPPDTAVTGLEWISEDQNSFQWSGSVRIEVYYNLFPNSPNEGVGAVAAFWVPDDVGSVTRTPMGAGLFFPRYRYEVSGLNLVLPADTYWIGAATAGLPGTSGQALWPISSRAPFTPLLGGEAHLRAPSVGIHSFTPWDNLIPGNEKYDVTFRVKTSTVRDCNCNGIPDDQDIDEETSLDCNGNGIPDECERDCNGNGIPDDCDIASGTSQDCNGNGVPDECDIFFGDSIDANENGIPDECECGGEAPLAEVDGVRKNRFISFVPGNAGEEVAIRVRMVSPPPAFAAFADAVRWVGPASSFEGTSDAAGLQCMPHCADWESVNLLHVFGAEIVPNATYEVQVVNCACDVENEFNYSEPLAISTRQWGDIVAPFSEDGGSVQPDVSDISALVSKFSSAPGAVSKARAKLQPNVINPSLLVDVSDISQCVNAFTGMPYPFSGPCGCPSVVACGQSCTVNAECGGGVCMSGECRDACGRCAP